MPIPENYFIFRVKTFHEHKRLEAFFEGHGFSELSQALYINTFGKLESPAFDPLSKCVFLCINKRISKARIKNAGYDLEKIQDEWRKDLKQWENKKGFCFD